MRRGPWLSLVAALSGLAGAVRAQEMRAPRLSVELRRDSAGALLQPIIRTGDLLDANLVAAMRNGFAVGFHFRLELWRDARLVDRQVGTVSWDAVARLDPIGNVYELLRSGGSLEELPDTASLARALTIPFTVDLLPPLASRERYYYIATLQIESLSLSELAEVEQWLRGDLGRALRERGDFGNALSRGARRLLIRLSGLPRRTVEVRSARFTP